MGYLISKLIPFLSISFSFFPFLSLSFSFFLFLSLPFSSFLFLLLFPFLKNADRTKKYYVIEERAIAVLGRFFAVSEMMNDVQKHWLCPPVPEPKTPEEAEERRKERRRRDQKKTEIRELLETPWHGHTFTSDNSEYTEAVHDQVCFLFEIFFGGQIVPKF